MHDNDFQYNDVVLSCIYISLPPASELGGGGYECVANIMNICIASAYLHGEGQLAAVVVDGGEDVVGRHEAVRRVDLDHELNVL